MASNRDREFTQRKTEKDSVDRQDSWGGGQAVRSVFGKVGV